MDHTNQTESLSLRQHVDLLIADAYCKHGHNVSETARALKVSVPTVRVALKRHEQELRLRRKIAPAPVDPFPPDLGGPA